MFAALTGIGLAAAAGLNAYIPFLIVGLLDRFTSVVDLPVGWEWMSSWWAIGVGAVLLVAEVVLDKVPAVDSVNDAVQTFVRPATGGMIFAATSAAQDLEQASWVQERPWVTVVAGVVVAGLVHAGKATARPVVDAATLGVGAPLVSTAEDGASVGLSLVAIFVPVLVLVGLALLVWAFVALRRRRRRASAGPAPDGRTPDGRTYDMRTYDEPSD
jgi:uncharacterized membrane protein